MKIMPVHLWNCIFCGIAYFADHTACCLLFLAACWCCLQLFFAKVLRSANEDDVKALFARYGRVVEVKLFRAFQVGVVDNLQCV
jgi:hypothetical protein